MRTWIIGSGVDCDLLVNKPTVSSRHCRLTELVDGYLLEDLGSSNGTFVNGERLDSPKRVSRGDAITLGLTVPLPWPRPAVSPDARIVRIGRDADNEIVLDDPRVSGHHARLVMRPGSPALIEDAGSSNGTCVNSIEQRADRPIAIKETDTVYFGTLTVPAAHLLSRAVQTARPVVLPAAESPWPVTAEPLPPEPTRSVPAPILAEVWLLAALAQAPILAVLIVLVFGRQASALVTPDSLPSVGQGIASTTFSLALAAIWLGCSLAVADLATGRSPRRPADGDPATFFVSLAARFGLLFSLAAVGCAALLLFVYWGNGLEGPWLALWSTLVLAAAVGLFLGLVVTALVPKWPVAVGVSLVCFLPMLALGGALWPLPDLAPPLKLAAGATPSRWAFEGLLLVETNARRVAPSGREPAAAATDDDPAERFFPSDSERMGPQADTMALGSMLIGLAAAAVFVSGSSGSIPRRP
jgi:pSer/pThr/pTyr-binding forkhead associated (FHA) protein